MRVSEKIEKKLPVPAGPDLQSLGLATAKLAHELNNPLDAALRFVSLAQRTLRHGQHDETERYLRDAQFGLQRMAEVLREILETGHVQEPPVGKASTAELAYVTRQASETLRPKWQAAHLTMALNIPEKLPVSVTLYQVLLNLIENAIDASPANATVTVNAKVLDDTIAISVHDHGNGIPAEDLPHLFEPFFTRKPAGEGTGLGLAVCKELISRLGGDIWAENANPGCVFHLRLTK